jgi:hypothetical protein
VEEHNCSSYGSWEAEKGSGPGPNIPFQVSTLPMT